MFRKAITLERTPPGAPGHPEPMPGIEFTSRTYCANEHVDICDVAIITIGQDRARYFLGLMDVVRGLHAMDPHIARLFVGDWSVTWWKGNYDKLRLDRESDELIPGPSPDPDGVREGGDGDIRTEYDYVRVDVDAISFQATPKHSEIDYWTDPIPRAVLERLAAPPAPRRKKVVA